MGFKNMKQVVRRLFRPFFPQSGRTFIEWAGPRFGRSYAVLAYLRSLFHPDRLVRVPVVHYVDQFVYLRPTIADQYVYDEVFRSGEYQLPVSEARFVIDAGGYIGLTSTLFSLRWPGAQIVVLEPNAANFRVLSANLGHKKNVRLVHGALWSHKTQLQIANPDDVTVSFRVEPGTGTDAFTVRELIDHQGVEQVDLLKMDIEGAEVEVFSSAGSWVNQVGAMIVELHDRFRPGCREALLAATQAGNFRMYEQGENTILVR